MVEVAQGLAAGERVVLTLGIADGERVRVRSELVARMPFEWIVALRFLREGRFQSLLIIGGAAIGVAVVIFITALVNGLQANTIRRVLGTQAHIVIRPTEEVARPQREAGAGASVLPRIEARAQRLRSIDQWQPLVASLDAMPELTGVSPMVSGPGFAVRGDATKAIALFGVDPPRYDRIVSLTERLVQGSFRVQANEAVIGKELAQDLGLAVGDRFRLVTSEGDTPVAETFTVTGIVDLGVRDLNRRSVYIGFRTAQAMLALPGGASQIDLRRSPRCSRPSRSRASCRRARASPSSRGCAPTSSCSRRCARRRSRRRRSASSSR